MTMPVPLDPDGVLKCPRCSGQTLLRGEVQIDSWRDDFDDGGIAVRIEGQHVEIDALSPDDEGHVGSKVLMSIWCSHCDQTYFLRLEMIDDLLRLEWD